MAGVNVAGGSALSPSALAAGFATAAGSAALDYRSPASVKDPRYGAKGDGVELAAAGAISSSSNTTTLTVAGAAFTSADVGKRIVVVGAGAAGANLYGTIATYVSATVVTVSVAASTTVTAAYVAYGTNDTAAFLAAIAAVSELYVPVGIYFITSWLPLKSNFRMYGAGATSIIYNDKSNATIDKRSCLLAGLTHPAAVSGAIWTSYACNALTAPASAVTTTTAGDAANFSVDEIAYVGSATNLSGVSSHGQLVKIRSISSGTVQLYDTIVRSISDPKIYKITGSDASTSTNYFVIENVIVENLGFKGRAALATKIGVYKGVFRNVWALDTHIGTASNCCSHVLFENWKGFYSGRLIEAAQNSHDIVYRLFDMQFKDVGGLQAGESQAALINIGEQSSRILVDRVNVSVDSRYTATGQLVQAKGYDLTFRDCTWWNGGTVNQETLTIPSSSAAGFYYDQILFDNCKLGADSGKSRIGIIGSSSTDPPQHVTFRNCTTYGAPSGESIWFQYGSKFTAGITDRSGKKIKISGTAEYPITASYRRAAA